MAAISDPKVDIRKPFKLDKAARGKGSTRTAAARAKDPGSYSGRSYDEKFIGPFALSRGLPVNSTTSFLTPAYRTNPITLTRSAVLTGKPSELYRRIVTLVNDVREGLAPAATLLAEIIRLLLSVKEERRQRMGSLLAALKPSQKSSLLSAEAIVALIRQHQSLPRSSRLPVLVVAAAYRAAQHRLGERHLHLRGHNVADNRAKALGDVEITLEGDAGIVTAYEMKAKRVTKEDIEIALQKMAASRHDIDNYIFITTEPIPADVADFAAGLHQQTGVEFVILDCIGFVRHFLHLFYRLRLKFLEAYQELLLDEPDSAVNQSLKEAFLSLRLAAEAGMEQAAETRK
ncbi:MAG: restriction endonuclease, SacI family [Acidobacteria bacterium]|nr:restriction endonuclease, SacI family [Acidobacteriota bacterium]